MARLGLGGAWKCLFANDNSRKKVEAYKRRFGDSPELRDDDIGRLKVSDLPPSSVLAWASFPCQDLSLAGNGIGLKGDRSGTFWPFWELMLALADAGHPVPIIVIENVVGAITSNGGRDFKAIISAVASKGYRVGALIVDAVKFVPQSRARLFLIAVLDSIKIPSALLDTRPTQPWHTRRLVEAYEGLPQAAQQQWVWWHLPIPTKPTLKLSDILEEEASTPWHPTSETKRLISMMSDANLAKLRSVKTLKALSAGTVYKRIRKDESGKKKQRAEVRFDGISGCLRTPVGGSSRQIVFVFNGRRFRSRLLSPREAARLMGVPDDYPLPESYNEAYHLMGDGLVVPVVQWLEQHLLRPLAVAARTLDDAAVFHAAFDGGGYTRRRVVTI